MLQTDKWGIDNGYEDALGDWRETPQETRSEILKAMRAGRLTEPSSLNASTLVVRRGERKNIGGPAEVKLEDGAVMEVDAFLPPDLPLGYHTLLPARGNEPRRLIVSPGICHLPGNFPTWGWSVQLYALRSKSSWGIGDLEDLSTLARWSASELRAGVLMVNPLHSASPVVPQQASPYFPGSRRYRNPLYIRIEQVPGASSAPNLQWLAEAGRKLNHQRRIDRDSVFRLKMEALESIWRNFRGDPAFESWCLEEGQALHEFAAFCALAETHGDGWRSWPAEHRHPRSPEVSRFAAANANRLRFHSWLQWLLDGQLKKASEHLAVMQDLPIGFDPDGADAWSWQDLLAAGVRVGAPPDEYNTQGQDWGLPPFNPHKLAGAGYTPFIETIRSTLRLAGGLRIDHVMGLFRLFWIPQGMAPAQGTYVRYPAEDLLAILALESQRAQAFIVGEDLGTIERSAQRQLAAHRILSYRLVWFEEGMPETYPELALAAITTHDLPTLAGLWNGSDIQTQKKLNLRPNETGTLEIRRKLRKMTALADDASSSEVCLRTHELLARAPSVVVTAMLDDALGVEERPNMPCTVEEQWPNWCIALPAELESIQENGTARKIAASLARRAQSGADS